MLLNIFKTPTVNPGIKPDSYEHTEIGDAYGEYVKSMQGKSVARPLRWNMGPDPNRTLSFEEWSKTYKPSNPDPDITEMLPTGGQVNPTLKPASVNPSDLPNPFNPTKEVNTPYPNPGIPTINNSPAPSVSTGSPKLKSTGTGTTTTTPARTPISLMTPKGLPMPTLKETIAPLLADTSAGKSKPADTAVVDPLDTALQEFNSQVDNSTRMSGIISAGKGLLNAGVILNELNRKKTDPFVAPVLEKPTFLSPGQYVKAAQDSQLAMMENTAQKMLQETGRSDAVIGVTADAMDKSNQINAQAAATDIDTANRNIEASVQIDNQQSAINAETQNKNIEKTMQENLASGMTITQAINALGEIGTQYVSNMTEADYKKWVAGMMMQKIKMQRSLTQLGLIPGMEDLTGGKTTLVPGTSTPAATTTEDSNG